MKNLSDAFFQYNIIENTEYLSINSTDYDYEKIKKGDIVFVSEYKYNSNKKGQFHLFLVTKKYGIYIHGMLITSKTAKAWYMPNIYVEKDNINNLKYDSLIKTDNLYLIKKDYILNKIGFINSNIFKKCINLNKIMQI